LPDCQGCRILPPNMNGPTTPLAQTGPSYGKLRSLGLLARPPAL
jgi:hypothetical protein